MKDVKEEKKKLVEICKNMMKTQEQENEVWKVDIVASLAVKELHAKELLELEKLKVKDKGIDLEILCKDKALVEKTLCIKCTAKDRLLS